MIPVPKPIRRAAQVVGVDAQLLADCLHDCSHGAVVQQVAHKQGASAELTLLRMLKTAHPDPTGGLGLTTRPRRIR